MLLFLYFLTLCHSRQGLIPRECNDASPETLDLCAYEWSGFTCQDLVHMPDLCSAASYAYGWNKEGCPDTVTLMGDLCNESCNMCSGPQIAQIYREDNPYWQEFATVDNDGVTNFHLSLILVAYSGLDTSKIDTSIITGQVFHPKIEEYFNAMDYNSNRSFKFHYHFLGWVHSDVKEYYSHGETTSPEISENLLTDPNNPERSCTDFSRTYLTESNSYKRELNGITQLDWDPETQAMTIFMPVLTKCVESAAWSIFSVLFEGTSRNVRGVYKAYNAPLSNGGTHGEYNPGMPYSELGVNGNYYDRQPDFVHPFMGTDTTLIHEFIHGFGIFYHADHLNCKDTPNCGTTEYGNTLSSIGRGDYAFELDPNERFMLHFMDTDDFLLIEAEGTFTIGPLEQALDTSHKRAAVIVGSTYSFFVEYRQAAGFDTSLDAFPDSDLGKNAHGIIITQGNNVIPVDGLSETVDSDGNLVWFSLVEGDSFNLFDTGIWVGNIVTHGHEGVTFEVLYGQTPPVTTLAPTSTVTHAPTHAQTEPMPCYDTRVEVQLITKDWGNEITWSVGPCSGRDYQNHKTYSLFCCLPVGTHAVNCEDSYGDGWHGGSLSVDGETVCSDFSGRSMTSTIEISSTAHIGEPHNSTLDIQPEATSILPTLTSQPSPSPSPEPSVSPSQAPSASTTGPTSSPHTSSMPSRYPTIFQYPSSSPSESINPSPTPSSFESVSPSELPTSFYLSASTTSVVPESSIHTTAEGSNQYSSNETELLTGSPTSESSEDVCFEIELTVVAWANEMSWTLGSCSGTGNNPGHSRCCLSQGDYTLECADSYGDGWHGGFIRIGEEEYCRGDSHWSLKSEAVQITTDMFIERTTELPEGLVCTDIELTTKNYGYEISWQLSNSSCSGNTGAYQNWMTYTKECCLIAGQHTLSCADSYGDGWHGGFITIQGNKYCEELTGYGGTEIVNILRQTSESQHQQSWLQASSEYLLGQFLSQPQIFLWVVCLFLASAIGLCILCRFDAVRLREEKLPLLAAEESGYQNDIIF